MLDALLKIDLTSWWVLGPVYGLSAAAFVYLLCKRRRPGWWLLALGVLIGGAALGLLVLWIAVDVLNAFGGPLNEAAYLWVPAAVAGIALAICNFPGARWWRRVIAALGIVLFALSATLGINAAYGITPTLGQFLHISTEKPIPVPTPTASEETDGRPLYERWEPPADLPQQGTTGLVEGGIPNTVSGFPARGASLYLPPAALVEHAPRLPLMVFFMGQPGDPDPSILAARLDAYAAEHRGLAPIGLVVDQLGDPGSDPMCIDSKLGRVETYVMEDVVPWAREHLNVMQERTEWVVGGYSNGGECAAYFGAKHPDVFGSLLSISGELFPGAEHADATLADVFGGDQAAYDALKPVNIMAAKAPYDDMRAIYTAGTADPGILETARTLADAASAAGIDATLVSIEGADHGLSGLNAGIERGIELLGGRLQLAPPG